MGTRTRAALPGSVTRTRTAAHSGPSRTTSVWTPAGTADGSPGLRSALPVGRTPTARLALTTDQSAGARTLILGTLCPAAVTSARETRSAGPHRNVTGSATGARTPAPGGPAGRAPTVRPSTTGPSAAARLTSWVTPTPGATQSAPGTGTAPPTRPA